MGLSVREIRAAAKAGESVTREETKVLEAMLTQAERARDNLSRTVEDMAGQRTELQEGIEARRAQVADLKAKLAAAQEKLANLRDLRAGVVDEHERDTAREEIADLKENLALAGQARSADKKLIRDLQVVNERRASIEELERRCASYIDEAIKLSEENNGKTAREGDEERKNLYRVIEWARDKFEILSRGDVLTPASRQQAAAWAKAKCEALLAGEAVNVAVKPCGTLEGLISLQTPAGEPAKIENKRGERKSEGDGA